MNLAPILQAAAAAAFLVLLAMLFALYRNPLLEIYLSDWGFC
jgi:hypothetical protein